MLIIRSIQTSRNAVEFSNHLTQMDPPTNHKSKYPHRLRWGRKRKHWSYILQTTKSLEEANSNRLSMVIRIAIPANASFRSYYTIKQSE